MSGTYGRILSVDDEPRIREKIATHLEDSGFVVFEANNGIEALDIIRDKKPDLVISDINMPNMNGLELLEQIKKDDPDMPFIVMSSTELMTDVIEALRQGAIDFVVKPISNMALLEQAVCRGLERGRLKSENVRYKKELEVNNMQLSYSLLQLKEDQDAGKSVQQKLLPQSNTNFGLYNITFSIHPSLYLSGDFVDYFEVNSDLLCFYIADVSGHGASSAFVTVLLKSIVEKMHVNYKQKINNDILNPEKVLQQVSDDILEAKLGKYLTMIYGIINKKTNQLTYCIGGHYPSPVIVSNQQAQFLPGCGFALGIFKNAEFKANQIELPQDFQMFMFSDGIFELMHEPNLEQKEKQLLAICEAENKNIQNLLSQLGMTDKGAPDDITALLISKAAS